MNVNKTEDNYEIRAGNKVLNTVFTGTRKLMNIMWSTVNVKCNESNKATKALTVKTKKR